MAASRPPGPRRRQSLLQYASRFIKLRSESRSQFVPLSSSTSSPSPDTFFCNNGNANHQAEKKFTKTCLQRSKSADLNYQSLSIVEEPEKEEEQQQEDIESDGDDLAPLINDPTRKRDRRYCYSSLQYDKALPPARARISLDIARCYPRIVSYRPQLSPSPKAYASLTLASQLILPSTDAPIPPHPKPPVYSRLTDQYDDSHLLAPVHKQQQRVMSMPSLTVSTIDQNDDDSCSSSDDDDDDDDGDDNNGRSRLKQATQRTRPSTAFLISLSASSAAAASAARLRRCQTRIIRR
ncbi:uncharacterized protein BYT42DRAFT_567649 [Radiomyces spectabilis]|uniref:uncharacterized protein n=1 Tax=Radiomyces spectabilis TaxID=64574 RepID=UPI00221F9A9D|nr:uncharacterized protein BYT42DRAFT_567649 [Radiomyces spectabilis]KAI8379128.1 hypothetical protein BYT42DRAFT_567649 [Radiomyces spectabilis]